MTRRCNRSRHHTTRPSEPKLAHRRMSHATPTGSMPEGTHPPRSREVVSIVPQVPSSENAVPRVGRRGQSFDEPSSRARQTYLKPTNSASRTNPVIRTSTLTSLPKRRCDDDTQQVEKTPSGGSVPFGEIRMTDRCASVCLPDAFRSQSFSPSQRFSPGHSSWLCFTPHPPLGFMDLQSFSHPTSRDVSRHPVLSCRRPRPHNETTFRSACPVWHLQRIGPTSGRSMSLCAQQWSGSRALLLPGIRHSPLRVNVAESRCSLGLHPLRGLPARPMGERPPLLHLPPHLGGMPPSHVSGATGSRSSRAWALLREARPTSMRLLTSYDRPRSVFRANRATSVPPQGPPA